MKTGRNDPCPCGSGRKYKQCCQPADAAREAGADFQSTQRFVLETARREGTWEADVVPLVASLADGSHHRPASVLITAGELVLRGELKDRLSGEPDALAEVIERELVLAARDVGTFPELLRVRYSELREPLQARLAPRAIAVEVAETLASEEAARGLIEHMTGEVHWPPVSLADTWAAWRLPAVAIRDLFAAAADFWRRAPWKFMDNEQAPEATFASGRSWTVGVMGGAGLQLGLSLYSDPDDIYAIAATEDSKKAMAAVRGRVISLTFDPVSDLPTEMTLEARASG
jgi:hypothetical protein